MVGTSEGAKKAAKTRGHESLAAAGRKGGQRSHSGKKNINEDKNNSNQDNNSNQ